MPEISAGPPGKRLQPPSGFCRLRRKLAIFLEAFRFILQAENEHQQDIFRFEDAVALKFAGTRIALRVLVGFFGSRQAAYRSRRDKQGMLNGSPANVRRAGAAVQRW